MSFPFFWIYDKKSSEQSSSSSSSSRKFLTPDRVPINIESKRSGKRGIYGYYNIDRNEVSRKGRKGTIRIINSLRGQLNRIENRWRESRRRRLASGYLLLAIKSALFCLLKLRTMYTILLLLFRYSLPPSRIIPYENEKLVSNLLCPLSVYIPLRLSLDNNLDVARLAWHGKIEEAVISPISLFLSPLVKSKTILSILDRFVKSWPSTIAFDQSRF